MSKLFTISEGLENMGAIKTGGQGSVYKGRRIGEVISAIKILPTPIISQDKENKHYRDFINEVAKLQRVSEEPNPNIVKLLSHGVSETGGFPYIEMEFIDGPDLAELLKPPHSPVFTVKEIINVAEQLSNALAHCHKLHVKHGDIKSNNVKYNQRTGNYVLLDFGLAILSNEERRTSLRRAGAIEFMAPEQNEGELFFETDVYSFGIIIYELLAGQVPFILDGNSETARNKVMIAHMETPPPDALALRKQNMPEGWSDKERDREMQVPGWVTSLIYKCLEKKPYKRFDNGNTLHEFVSQNRIHTPGVPALVNDEDAKWRAGFAKKEAELKAKENELEELKAIVLKQDSELQAIKAKRIRYLSVADPAAKKTVSRATFTTVLAAAIIVGCIAVYSLFFNKSAVGAVQADNITNTSDSVAGNKEPSGLKNSENNNTAKKISNDERKKKAADSIAAIKKEEQKLAGNAGSTQEITGFENQEEEAANNDNAESESEKEVIKYKVRNTAFFHDEPDEDTKREAFIVHWNNAVLKPLDEKAGFIYVIFTNYLGQTSKGWLSKADLIQVK